MKVMIHACPDRLWYVEGFLLPELRRQGAEEIRVWYDGTGRGNLLSCMEAFASLGTGEDASPLRCSARIATPACAEGESPGTGERGRPGPLVRDDGDGEADRCGGTGDRDPSSAPSGRLPPGEGRRGEDTWHLQDDILLCRDFVRRAEELEAIPGILCGFVSELGGPDCNLRGRVYIPDMWYSFPCIRIPDALARGCAKWFLSGAWKQEADPAAFAMEAAGRGDDWFFREYMELRHGGETVLNLVPCLVEHVDWLLGGSVVSRWRGHPTRAVYWEDEERVEELKRQGRSYFQ